ncbi:MAG: hypothetical protein ACK476_02800 [Fluviicola sp.]
MKKLAILFILCFFGQTAFSQTAPTYSKEYVVGQSNEIKAYFSLSEPTSMQIMNILYETNEYIKEVNARVDIEESQKGEKRFGAYRTMDQKINMYLTVEQQQDYDNFKQQSTYFQY